MQGQMQSGESGPFPAQEEQEFPVEWKRGALLYISQDFYLFVPSLGSWGMGRPD